eukprot:TRINITY_DN3571_c0_g1_i2.p1 TRINITY_DN3571_c0_g1~~TRINITY_DN3571_c0_g1_i2.p1  ORF type:complete len:289 (+),score=39.30 TRINITY_DN3571_c0_g1_i2:172-1038(+)
MACVSFPNCQTLMLFQPCLGRARHLCYFGLKQKSGYYSRTCQTPLRCVLSVLTGQSRQRMMYASSQQILKRQLGASCFTRDIFGTQPDDFNYAAYELSIKGDDSSALLTKAEVESKAELVETSLSANHSTGASTLSLPLSHAAQAALRSLASRDVNFVLIRIDDKSETMELDCAKNIALSTLEAAVPNAVPRYLLVRLGDDVIFVYSCPDASPVRGRMVYSTSKAAFALMTKELGVDIKKKLEVRDSSELSESSLRTELGSGESGATHHSTQIFSKPARPGRGAARLI